MTQISSWPVRRAAAVILVLSLQVSHAQMLVVSGGGGGIAGGGGEPPAASSDPCEGFATLYYVRDGASGSGTSWTDAYDTLPATLDRDSCYYVADGTYASYTFDDAASGTEVIAIGKATEEFHGTDTGWDSAYGDGQADFGTLSFATDDWVFDGAVGGGPDSWSSGHGFFVFSSSSILVSSSAGVDNITVRHTHFDSDRGATFIAGFKNVGGFSNHTFSYCAFTEIFGPIFHIGTATNLTIEYSYLFDNKNTAEDHSEGISSIGTNTNVVLRWSLWDSIEGTAVFAGVNFGESVGWEIYGNIFSRSVTPVYYYWEDPGTNQNEMTDSYILNNTIVGENGISQGAFIIQQGSGNVAYNNLFYNNDANSFGMSPTHDYSFASDNIRSDGGPIDKDSEVLTGEANGQDSSGSPFASYNADPLLADFEATTNAGFDTGALVPGNDVDMFGMTRAAWTRGAIE